MLGDLDGDAVQDLAVGSIGPEGIWALFLNIDGTVKGYNYVPSTTPGDGFGRSVTMLGDLTNDGFPEIVVGTPQDFTDHGAVYLVSLHANGSVYLGESAWANELGGDYDINGNWLPYAVPGSNNPVLFNIDAIYSVNLNSSVGNNRIRVKAGDVTLNQIGFDYALLSHIETGFVVGEVNGDIASLTLGGAETVGFDGHIGSGAGSDGQVTVTGSQSTLRLTNSLCIGCTGTGSLIVENGAQVVTGLADVGRDPGSWGDVLITGSSSQWSVPNALHIDHGIVTLTNGGVLTVGLTGATILHGSEVAGDGTIVGNVDNFGSIHPGVGLGTLTIMGDYSQISAVSSGSLHVEMDALVHDVLSVSGSAQLGGSLILELLNGYEPSLNETFDVLQAALITGEFDVALFPGLSNGKYISLQSTARAAPGSSVTIEVLTLATLINMGLPDAAVTVAGIPTDVAVGDLDMNGSLDIAITLSGSPGSVLLLFNDGSGGFASSAQITVGNEPSAVAIGDFYTSLGNNVVVANAADGEIEFLINDGSGIFSNGPTILCWNKSY